MKLLQLLILLYTIKAGAALGNPTFQPTTDDTYSPTTQPTTIEDEATNTPTMAPTTKDSTLVPSPVPTVDDETYSPTAEPTIEPTTRDPTLVPTVDDETYSPTAELTTYANKKSAVDTKTTVYTSALSQPVASVPPKPNGSGGAIAAGFLVPMIILVAYGFGVYRRKRADEREEITETDQEQQNGSEDENITHDNDTEKLQDVELV